MGFTNLIKLDIQKFAAGLSISYSTVSQDVSTNKSVVRITCTVSRVSGSTYWVHPNERTLTITCDGQTYSVATELPSNQTSVTYTHDFTVSHNNDGTKTISFSGNIPASGSFPALSASGSGTLLTIPRYAYFTTQPKYVDRTETTLDVYYKPDRNISSAQYRIKKSTASSYGSWNYLTVISGTWNTTAGCTFRISGLDPDTKYIVQMRIQNANVNWTNSNEVSSNMYTYAYPYLKAVPDFTIGMNEIIISLYNPKPRSVSIAIKYGSTTIKTITTTGTMVAYNSIPDASTWYSKIPNNTSGTYSATSSYSGHTSTKSNKFYAAKSNCIPQFTNFTYADTDTTTTELTDNPQKIIIGYSDVKVNISSADKAAPRNSASIKKYKFECGEKSTTKSVNDSTTYPVSTSSLADVAKNVFKVTAIDSRGYEKSVTKTVSSSNTINYEPLKKTSASVYRTDNIGTETRLKFSGTMWVGNFGATPNAITQSRFRYQRSGGNWSAYKNVTPTLSGGTFSFNALIVGDEDDGFNVDNVYTVEVTVKDKLSTAQWILTLNAGKPHVAYYKKGVSIMGKYDETRTDALQVNGNANIKGNILRNGNNIFQTISSAGGEGCVKIGNIGIEWGIASVTSGTTAYSSGGLTFYGATSDTINFQNTYAKTPAVFATWSGNYYNQHSLYTTNKTISSAQVGGYLFTSGSSRNIAWVIIGILS